jgi:glutathione S-transferase
MSELPVAKDARFTLYGNALSPFVRKISVVLHEKSIPFELAQFNIFAPPAWFADISPLRRIPVLRDGAVAGGGFIADSSVIAAYVERLFPSPALMPADAWDAARVLWLEEYADTELFSRIGAVFRPRILGRFTGEGCDESRVQVALTEALPRCLDYLEDQLAGHDYFVSDTLSLADITIATFFVNLHHAQEKVDAAQYPGLAAFVHRMHKRDSFAPLIAMEQAMMKRFSAAS